MCSRQYPIYPLLPHKGSDLSIPHKGNFKKLVGVWDGSEGGQRRHLAIDCEWSGGRLLAIHSDLSTRSRKLRRPSRSQKVVVRHEFPRVPTT